MVGGHDGHERLGHQGHGHGAGLVVGVADDGHVEGAGGEAFHQVAGEALDQVHIHEGEAGAEFADAAQGFEGQDRGDEAQVQGALAALADAGDLGQVAFGVAEQGGGALAQHGSGGGEGDCARGAVEQPRAEQGFQALDLLGERGLGDVQAGGGAAEVQFVGDGQEIAQVP